MLNLSSIHGKFALLVTLLPVIAVTSVRAQRLPRTVVPSHYQLALDPDINAQKFSGEETITVQIQQETNEITLNSLGLDISSAEVTAGGVTSQAGINYDQPSEMVKLSFAKPVAAGAAKLHIKYSAKLVAGLRGLYLSKGAHRQYAVTQFEGTYARMMFPSFDEPGFKATFDLSVVVDKGDTAISNGHIIKDEPVSGSSRHKLTFSTSPKMSTYLVALAIGDWQCLERTVDGVPIRVCAEPDKKQFGQFALDAASQSIKFYNQWYGIKYPFGKLDMVAIPDYEWGGMENTASIFYRDTALLMDDKTASVSSKRSHATVVAHEIAHQWFGDLVTAAWWDDIWLNEGFATWMERKPISAWHPEWHLEDDEADSAQRVIGVDSLSAARAIHGDPKTSSEIKEMFDGITYEKGGAVLGMLESYVGPDVFRKGVNAYLQAHANGNATSADFWHAEAQVSGKPVDKIMPTFVMQPGVPLLTVNSSCANGKTTLQLSQQRFLVGGTASQSQTWSIPVCTKAAQNAGSACYLADKPSETFTADSCSDWIFANRNAKGYYRVFYQDQKNLMNVAAAAEKDLTVSERIALVEDLWAMTRAGKESVGVFLDVAKTLRSEHSRPVVTSIAEHLGAIESSLIPEDKQKEYRNFVREQFTPLAKELSWTAKPRDSDEQKALRASLLKILGGAGDPDAVAAAKQITQAYMKDPKSVDGTIIGPAIDVTAENGDAALYNQFSDAMNRAKAPDEYYTYFGALAAFRDPELVKRTLSLVDQGKIRQQDYLRLFPALLSNPAGRELAWEYLKEHWDSLAEKVTSFGGRGAVSSLGDFCSTATHDEIQQFFADHRAPGAERALKQSLERIKNCTEFTTLQGKNMEQWLSHPGN